MFGEALDRLQQLFGRRFLFASFLPVLLFVVLNGALLYFDHKPFEDFVNQWATALSGAGQGGADETGAGSGAPITGWRGLINVAASLTVVALSVAIAAWVFSFLNTALRETLEGKHLPEPLRLWCTRRQYAFLDALGAREIESSTARNELVAIRDHWVKGAKKRRRAASWAQFDNERARRACVEVERLLDRRAQGALISPEQVRIVVDELDAHLRNVPRGKLNPTRVGYRAVLAARAMDSLLDYAVDRQREEFNEVASRRYFNFPAFGTVPNRWSVEVLAPTRMGNIARSMESYTTNRYRLRLEVFWPRLQKILMEDEAFYGTIQDSKMRLDFLVTSFWLAIATSAIWTVRWWITAVLGPPEAFDGQAVKAIAAFLIGALGGHLIYGLCVRDYRVYATLVRSAVDHFRLKLLTALRVPAPSGSTAEQQVWEMLTRRFGFGEDVHFAYAEPDEVVDV